MKRLKGFFLFIAVFLLARSQARAGLLGDDPSAVTTGLWNFVTTHAWHLICSFFRWGADFFVQALFKVYGWLGTRLLYIPDFADPQTYSGAPGASSMVFNVMHIMEWIGFILLAVMFMFYMGRLALGLTGQSFTVLTLARLIGPVLLLFSWPTIVSESAKISTNLAFYLYHQNLFNTQNVLDGLNNLDATQPLGGGSVGQAHKASLIYEVNLLKYFAYSIATFLGVVGLIYGWSRIKEGKNGGFGILATAMACLMMIFFTPNLISYFSNTAQLQNLGTGQNSDVIPGGTGSSQNFPTANFVPNQGNFVLPGEQTPSQLAIAVPNTGSNPQPGPTSTSQYDPQDTFQNIISSVVKCCVALWGIFICIGVLVAKGYQVFSVFILFLLGFPLIGLLGHPSTENITLGGLKLFLKLHLYGPIWGLALLAMNCVIFARWGTEGGAGTGSIMTAFLILAGLSIIQNTQDFAGIFSSFNWGSGGSAHGFMRDAMAGVRTGAGMAAVSSGIITQKGAGFAGGAMVGAAAGVVGLAGGPGAVMALAKAGYSFGSKAGEHSTKSINAVSNNLAGRHRQGLGPYIQNVFPSGEGSKGKSGYSPSKAFAAVRSANSSYKGSKSPYDIKGSNVKGGGSGTTA